MAVLFSRKFNISQRKLQDLGVFNSLLDEDSHFFINFKRLQQTRVPEFKEGYSEVNNFFSMIGNLLSHSREENDRFYREAKKRFSFSEVNGINLGFSKGTHGAGFGGKLRDIIIRDAFDIIKAGTTDPEFFHLLSLFEENVGPDRLSDMLAGILEKNIVDYTRKTMSKLDITPTRYPKCIFANGIPENPYKKHTPVLLLPTDILHELPIAKDWFDIDRACRENEAIRAEINSVIGDQWSRLSSVEKKRELLNELFLDPSRLQKVIDAYRKTFEPQCNFSENLVYFTELVKDHFKDSVLHGLDKSSSFDSSCTIIENYKEWVELHRGWTILGEVPTKKAEHAVQKTIHAIALMHCKAHDLDISPEADSGCGPEDFKISRGNDKTVIEVKLTSNQHCVHGLETQIEAYARSENTQNKIFVLVDNGRDSSRVQAVMQKHKELFNAGKNPATIILIDANSKISASKA